MARIETPVDQLAFEIEHFEWTAADRLEVSGRWFGVRGQRFMRPTLHLRVDGRRRRLIALLDHKPWAPDTEQLWTAAFAWRGDRGAITGARLEVSTDIVLDLPAPGSELPTAPIAPRPRPQRDPRHPPPLRRPAAPPIVPAGTEPQPDPPVAAAAAEPPPEAAPERPPIATADDPQRETAAAEPRPIAAANQPPPEAAIAAASTTPPDAAPAGPPPEAAAAEPPPTAEPVAAEPPPVSEPRPAPADAEPGAAVVSSSGIDGSDSAGAPASSTADDAPIAEIDPPAVPAHAPSTVTAEIAALALERRLVEERTEREVLARDLADARQRIEALSSHHESAVVRAQEIVDLEGQLAVANARADAAQAHVDRLERELARVTAADAAPLAPRTPRRRGEPEWDRRTKVTAGVAVAVALLVVLVILISLV